MNYTEKMKRKYGADFFAKIGAKGGAAPHSTPVGWQGKPDAAKAAGSKGGSKSKRGYTFVKETTGHLVYTKKDTGETVMFLK